MRGYVPCDPPPDVLLARTLAWERGETKGPRTEFALDRRTAWNKTDFTVSFLDGTPDQHDIVLQVMEGPFFWSSFSGVTYQVVQGPEADIRITCQQGRSWSQLGSNSTNGLATVPSMQLGFLDDDVSFWEAQRVVIHEFGHALGLIHEHQSPAAYIPWNVPVVMEHYLSIGWTENMVRVNVLEGWDISEITNYSDYDPASIQAYWLAAEWVLDPAYAHAPNNVPSATDRAYAAARWGPPKRKWWSIRLPIINRTGA